jgi:hypothetical protein
MKQAITGALGAVILMGGAYLLGRLDAAAPPSLHAQGGRGPVIPPKPRDKEPTTAPAPLVYGGESGAASVNNGFMAVTGSYGVGTSVLYLIDTDSRHLSVYEARGGTQSMRRLVWVGARRIDLDFQTLDYNDESEYKRVDLERMLGQGGGKKVNPSSVTVPGDLKKGLGTGEYKTQKKTGGR